MKYSLAVSTLLLFGSVLNHAAGQQTALHETFDSGVFPPSGWSEVNNGNSAGWEDPGLGAAFHDDFTGMNDNRLLTSVLDLTSFSEAYLHLRHSSQWTAYRAYNLIETTLDGGLTYGTLRVITDEGDFIDQPLDHSLHLYVGQNGLQLAFRYIGDFGNEWSLEEVVVDDLNSADVPRWPNLPTTSIPADGIVEDFEGWAGSVPSHLAINRVDEETRYHADLAWCNIGQLAPNLYSQGNYSLEMGVDPSWSGQHYYSNALIMKLDGSDAANLWLEFDAMNHGEEGNPDDGVFFSLDGEDWNPVVADWDLATGGFPNLGSWQTVRAPITTFRNDTSGEFYLAFCEAENRAYGQYDGLAIDNIRIFSAPLVAGIGNGAGFKAWIRVSYCQPGSLVEVMYSKIGPGPTPSAYGLLDLSQPILTIARVPADAAGEVLLHGTVPPFFGGTMVWLQAGMMWDGVGIASNSMAIQF